MFKQKRLTVLSLAVLLALLAAATMPLAALAQDEVPPQTEVPAVVEEEPVAEESVAEEPAAEEPATEEITVPEILEQLPEDTALVVLDKEGEALPFASTEAAEVLAVPDPYFTVGGTTYRFFGAAGACIAGGYSNCFDDSLTPIQDAIEYLSTMLKASPDNGNVYVEAGTYEEDVYVSGAAWLTDGGTVPLSLGIIGAGSGSTTLNGSFTIVGMNAFTLSGFTVNTDDGWSDSIDVINGNGLLQLTNLVVDNDNEESNGVRVENHTGNVDLTTVSSTSLGAGIEIDVTSGNVTLNNVTTVGNLFGGSNVYTENGSVAVNGGNFSNNYLTGLNINANGNVTLDNVTATENDSYGVGIFVDNGNVSLNSVISTDNGENGVNVSTANGSITINRGNFSNNQDGLDTRTDNGNITLNNVTSMGNKFEGVYVWTPGTILVNGGDFSNNGGWGLYLSSSSGVITVESVTATGNLDGARLGASDVDVICGNYLDNGGYGLVLNGGNTYLGGPILAGNGLGQYDLVSGTLSFGECPKPADKPTEIGKGQEGFQEGFKVQNNLFLQIPLTGQICNGEKKVALKAGDAYGMYENLCGIEFQLNEVTEKLLPGALSSGAAYAGGMEIMLTSGGIGLAELPTGGKITLRFPIPDGVDEASLAVLFWSGATWVEVPGGEVVDGFYVVEVTEPGIYVLASQ